VADILASVHRNETRPGGIDRGRDGRIASRRERAFSTSQSGESRPPYVLIALSLKRVDLGLERDDLDFQRIALDLESIDYVIFLAEFDKLAADLVH
jgi:hypothetical protein